MRIFLKILKIAVISLFVSALLFVGGVLYLNKTGVIYFRGMNMKSAGRYLLLKYNPFKKENLNRKEALEDAEELFASFERIHPEITAYIGKSGYAKLKEWTVNEIEKKVEQNGKISVKELSYILHYSASAIGDAHTGIIEFGNFYDYQKKKKYFSTLYTEIS